MSAVHLSTVCSNHLCSRRTRKLIDGPIGYVCAFHVIQTRNVTLRTFEPPEMYVCFDVTRIQFTTFFSLVSDVLAINYPYLSHHWFGSIFDAPTQRNRLCRSSVVPTKKRRRVCVKTEHLSAQRFPDVSRFDGAHFSGQNAKAIPNRMTWFWLQYIGEEVLSRRFYEEVFPGYRVLTIDTFFFEICSEYVLDHLVSHFDRVLPPRFAIVRPENDYFPFGSAEWSEIRYFYHDGSAGSAWKRWKKHQIFAFSAK